MASCCCPFGTGAAQRCSPLLAAPLGLLASRAAASRMCRAWGYVMCQYAGRTDVVQPQQDMMSTVEMALGSPVEDLPRLSSRRQPGRREVAHILAGQLHSAHKLWKPATVRRMTIANLPLKYSSVFELARGPCNSPPFHRLFELNIGHPRCKATPSLREKYGGCRRAFPLQAAC